MDVTRQLVQAGSFQLQRNVAYGVAGGSLLLNLVFGFMLLTRSEQVILQPVIQQPLTITSSRVTRDYLELVTRDTAISILNRSPQSLNYWMNNVLKLTDPEAYGKVKADMLRITKQLRGSDITQYFEPQTITVDPDELKSEVTGIVHVFLGSKKVSANVVKYRFDWTYRGLTLKMSGFNKVEDMVPTGAPRVGPNQYIERGGE
jgi:conjugal transfer pilus assembly protein TraE